MAVVKNICLEALERHCESGETGCLDLQHGLHQGQVYIHDQLITHAQIGNLTGTPALFRLFDWGDAETIWQMDVLAEEETLHLPMETATVMYAEHMAEMADYESEQPDRNWLDPALAAPELVAEQTNGVDTVLKNYNIILDCSDKAVLPEGFTLNDTSKSSYVIGSSEECDIVLRHPSIDPIHCGMILERGSVLIWDLGASTGVFVNGQPTTQDILKVGDKMTLGALELGIRFQLRRPTVTRAGVGVIKPATGPVPDLKAGSQPPAAPKAPAPTAPMRGPITYEKVAAQLKNNSKAGGFLNKLGSLFGGR